MKNFRKICTTLLLLSVSVLNTFAQDAKTELNKVANRLKTKGGIEVTFYAEVSVNGQPEGHLSGTFCLLGEKFKLSTGATTTWFDGKSLWTMMNGSDEVNLSAPTQEELQTINPYLAINLYKDNYQSKIKSVKKGNTQAYEINLKSPQKNSAVKEINIMVDANNHKILALELQQSRQKIHFQIKDYKESCKWSPAFFQFQQKDYPDVTVVDLR